MHYKAHLADCYLPSVGNGTAEPVCRSDSFLYVTTSVWEVVI